MTIEVAYGCHNGRIRKNNEDNFCINGRTLPLLHNGLPQVQIHKVHTAHPLLVGVFDGMGGEEAGEVASFTAASTCAEISLDSDTGPADFLRACCMHMNRAVCAEAEKLVFDRMGTTAALVFFFFFFMKCICDMSCVVDI